MSYKDEKIVKVLLEEVKNADERCSGYHEELTEAIAEVVQKERAHLFQKTNIVVEIGEIIGRVGTFIGLMSETTEEKS
jgi:hypothetical protein